MPKENRKKLEDLSVMDQAVIFGRIMSFYPGSFAWYYTPHPKLEGQTPKEALDDYKADEFVQVFREDFNINDEVWDRRVHNQLFLLLDLDASTDF